MLALRSTFRERDNPIADPITMGLTLALLLVGPLFFFTPNALYLGYLPAHVYHNPTILVLKPFALPLFSVAIIGFGQRPPLLKSRRLLLVGTSLLAFLAPLAKPNLAIAVLPAIALTTAWMWWRKIPLDWPLLAAILLPSLLVLVYQYSLTFEKHADTILLNPFGFLKARGRYDWMVFPKFFLSIAFPLTVYALYFSQARRNIVLNFAWLLFGLGAFYSYMLTENVRLVDGNFTWSGQITLFVLFVISTSFLLEHCRPVDRPYAWRSLAQIRAIVGWGVFLLHVGCGVYWYVINLAGAESVTRW